MQNTTNTAKIPTDNQLLLLLESRDVIPEELLPPAPKTSLRKIISPLRYPGGKSRVIDQISQCIHSERTERFIEVFAGGASLGLSLLEGDRIRELVLNELDAHVFNFWKVVLERPDELIAMLEKQQPSLAGYFIAKERLFNLALTPDTCDVQAAYDFLFLNRTSFGGIILANPIGGKNGNDSKMLARWNPPALSRRISRIAAMKDKISLTRMDAIAFLRELPENCISGTTIFIDPPYTKAGKKLYRESFEGRHEELANVVRDVHEGCPGIDIILTYDDCKFVRGLYPDAAVRQLRTSWSIYRPQDKTA